MAIISTTANISSLRAITGASAGDVYEVLGYYGAGDGGGGSYYCDTADLSSLDNGGSVIVANDGKRWKLHATGGFSVRQFGARGNGSADDTASINKAISATGAGTLYWPAGTYLVSGGLVQAASQSWQGAGGQRATTIKKMGNFDLVTLGDLGAIQDINLECQGGSYSGRGIVVSNGFSQLIRRVRISQSQGIALEFALNQGGGSTIADLEATTTNPTTVAAVKLSDNTASPKFFSNIWLSGGLFDFSAGGNGVSVTNFYARNLLTSASTALLHIANGRFASLSDPVTLSGSDITLTGVAFSGLLALKNMQGAKITACTLGSGFTEEAATCQYNEVYDQRKPYTPLWTQPEGSGAQPSIGNGSITASYQRSGHACLVSIRVVTGSTTTYGNGTSGYQLSLPFKGHLSVDQRGLPAVVTINGTTYPCWATIGANENVLTLGFNGQSVRLGHPAAWTAGSTIDLEFSYLVR